VTPPAPASGLFLFDRSKRRVDARNRVTATSPTQYVVKRAALKKEITQARLGSNLRRIQVLLGQLTTFGLTNSIASDTRERDQDDTCRLISRVKIKEYVPMDFHPRGWTTQSLKKGVEDETNNLRGGFVSRIQPRKCLCSDSGRYGSSCAIVEGEFG
jgi:hypothetical protein